MLQPKVSLTVGHTSQAPGAMAVEPISKHEYWYNLDFCQKLMAVLKDDFNVAIYFRDHHTINETYDKIWEWRPDANIEFHFNASTDPLAFGTGTLCNPVNQEFACAIQRAQIQAFKRVNRGDRGVEIVSTDQTRGWMSVNGLGDLCAKEEHLAGLSQIARPNCLIEPFFGTNITDCRLALESQEDLCRELHWVLKQWFADHPV